MVNWVSNGFKSWNHQCALSLKRVSMKAKTLNAALAAEDTVGDVLESFGCSVYLRKRVYVPEQRRNREIDCIALCNGRVLVIEVKNWRGNVWCNGIRWFQQASAKSGGNTLEFGDLIGEADMKTRGLWRHFEYDHKVRLPEEAFVTVVVFTNKLARLDPGMLEQHRNVFTLATFTEYIEAEMRRGSGPLGGQLGALAGRLFRPLAGLWSVVRWARGGYDAAAGGHEHHIERLSAADAFKVRAVCQQIRTWDVIIFLNGAVVHGDVIAVELPSVGLSLLRSDVRDLNLIWTPQNLLGLLQSVWSGSACAVKVMPTGDALKKLQGQAHNRRFIEKQQQRDREQREQQSPEGGGNRGGRSSGPSSSSSPSHSQSPHAQPAAKPLLNVVDYTEDDGSVEFPVLIQENTSMLRNDRLVYKTAGKSTPLVVPLYHIRVVELSASRSAKNVGHFVETATTPAK